MNKHTLTVAIPAYNEELTIENILTDLLEQKRDSFSLDGIFVYCDGSTDKTAEIVKKMQKTSSEIKLIEGKERLGKMKALNRMFSDIKSDFLIVLDSDIGLDGDNFLNSFVNAAMADPGGKLFAAHQIPLRPKNFTGRLLFATYAMWDEIRFSIPKKDHVQNFYGAATLYKKEVFHKMRIPDEAIEGRVYQYLMAKKEGGFSYVDDAVIYYWPPLTFHDFFKHAERAFGTEQPFLKTLFGTAAENIHVIPWNYKLKGIFRYFLRDPFYAPLALAFNFILSRLTLKKPPRTTPLWEIAISTKRPIKISQKPKIFFSSFDDIYNPTYGGGGAVSIHEVARRLSARYDIKILSGNYRGSKNGNVDGVSYRHIGAPFLGPRFSQLVFHFLLPFHALFRKYDLWVESFTPPFSTSFIPLWTRKPVIGLVHMLSGEEMSRKYHLPFTLLENFGLKFYKNFIVLTDDSKGKIRGRNHRAEIEVIPNGVNLPETPNLGENKSGHLSYIGRIEIGQKGIDLLIKSYAKIVPELQIPLAIAGVGPKSEVAEMKRLIKEKGLSSKINIAGRVDGEKKAEFLRNTKIGIIPSRFETFSLAALEMMSYGIPVVAFNIPGVKWIREGSIVKVKAFDEKMLAEAVLRLLRDKDYYREISLRAREEAAKYNWDRISLQYEKFIWKKIL